ncbi:MAG: restriction endonuclease [Spirochaetales bacterium]|nr:restriction endonuclease [Spirochaetales bacterium]
MANRELVSSLPANLAFVLDKAGALPEIKQPFLQAIFLLEVRVAGLYYIDAIQDLLNHLDVGERVKLIREPENHFDSRAIRILNTNGDFLGFVSRVDNCVLSRLMDGGKALFAEVANTGTTGSGNATCSDRRCLHVKVFMED